MARWPGRLVLVVGPSGAGKDSLLRQAAVDLAQDRHIVFPRRVITRPSLDEAEAHDSVTVTDFHKMREAGRFALSWEAHGFHYGIPITIIDDLKLGRMVAVNVSRAVIAETGKRFPNMAVLNVTAPLAVIAERLAKRGRESAADIAARLAREPPHFEGRFDTVTIINDGQLEAAARAFTSTLLQLSKAIYAATI